jgi:hypothetical protein
VLASVHVSAGPVPGPLLSLHASAKLPLNASGKRERALRTSGHSALIEKRRDEHRQDRADISKIRRRKGF